jgi:hypothetical protein
LFFFVMRYAAAHCFNNYIANKPVLLVGLGQQFAMQVNLCSVIVTTTHLYFQNVLFNGYLNDRKVLRPNQFFPSYSGITII